MFASDLIRDNCTCVQVRFHKDTGGPALSDKEYTYKVPAYLSTFINVGDYVLAPVTVFGDKEKVAFQRLTGAVITQIGGAELLDPDLPSGRKYSWIIGHVRKDAMDVWAELTRKDYLIQEEYEKAVKRSKRSQEREKAAAKLGHVDWNMLNNLVEGGPK